MAVPDTDTMIHDDDDVDMQKERLLIPNGEESSSSWSLVHPAKPKEARRILPLVFGWLVVLACILLLTLGCCSRPTTSSSVSIKPIHPLHHGHVTYQATKTIQGSVEYSREFTAPCDYGILVFNIGPAKNYLPYSFDLYQDAYVYSNNQNWCFFYPSYQGIQKGSPFPFWNTGDATSFNVKLGGPPHCAPRKISSRIVTPPGTKQLPNVKEHGGDFLIMARGDFYTPAYYKALEGLIHSYGSHTDMEEISNDDLQQEQLLKDIANLTLHYSDLSLMAEDRVVDMPDSMTTLPDVPAMDLEPIPMTVSFSKHE